MMAFQGLKNFLDHAEKLNGGVPVDFCNLNYPGSATNYDRNGTINLSNDEPKLGHPESYASWDVIGHEYGHHLQQCFGIADNPGGPHTIPSNNIDDQYEDNYTLQDSKDRGHRLSWGEGWPTFWSTVAQESFPSDLKTIETVGDSKYTSDNGLDYDLDDCSYGYADEQAIQRFLYKLYYDKVDGYDKFALGELKLWNLIISNKPHKFYDFIETLYDNGYNKNDLGILLGQYNMVPKRLEISSYSSSNPPTFTWSTYMGSVNLRYNEFDLHFYNQYGAEITEISNIRTSNDDCVYTIPQSAWIKILNASGDNYSVSVVSRQTDYHVSGNYYSQSFVFSKPVN